jgi:hypothetical protein
MLWGCWRGLLVVALCFTPFHRVEGQPTAAVTGVTFTDYDGDTGEVKGTVRWTPVNDSLTTFYHVYLSTDGVSKTTVLTRSKQVPASSSEFKIPHHTPLDGANFIIVTAANGDGESSTSAVASLSDTVTSGGFCPEFCSGNGACRSGRCVCYPGFSGDACQLGSPWAKNVSRTFGGRADVFGVVQGSDGRPVVVVVDTDDTHDQTGFDLYGNYLTVTWDENTRDYYSLFACTSDWQSSNYVCAVIVTNSNQVNYELRAFDIRDGLHKWRMTGIVGFNGTFYPSSTALDANHNQFLSLHPYPYRPDSESLVGQPYSQRYFIAPVQHRSPFGVSTLSLMAIDATGNRLGLSTALVYSLLTFPTNSVFHPSLDAVGVVSSSNTTLTDKMYYTCFLSGSFPDDVGEEWTDTLEFLDTTDFETELGVLSSWPLNVSTSSSKRIVMMELPDAADLPSVDRVPGDGAVVTRQIVLPPSLRYTAMNFDYVSVRIIVLTWTVSTGFFVLSIELVGQAHVHIVHPLHSMMPTGSNLARDKRQLLGSSMFMSTAMDLYEDRWFGVFTAVAGQLDTYGLRQRSVVAVNLARRELDGEVFKCLLIDPDTPLPSSFYASPQNTLSAVAGLGDLNLDGVPDIAIHTSGNEMFVLFLSSTGSVSEFAHTTVGSYPTNCPGASIATVGDVDGDTIPDLAVGCSQSNSVYIYFLTTEGFVDRTSLISGSLSSFGSSVASMGDVDGNGVPDLLVGSPTASTVSIVLLTNTGSALSTIDIDNLSAMRGFHFLVQDNHTNPDVLTPSYNHRWRTEREGPVHAFLESDVPWMETFSLDYGQPCGWPGCTTADFVAVDATFTLTAVLDDRYHIDVDDYRFHLTINGQLVTDVGGRSALGSLDHGTPSGGPFRNFRAMEFSVPPELLVHGDNTVQLELVRTPPEFWVLYPDWAVVSSAELEVHLVRTTFISRVGGSLPGGTSAYSAVASTSLQGCNSICANDTSCLLFSYDGSQCSLFGRDVVHQATPSDGITYYEKDLHLALGSSVTVIPDVTGDGIPEVVTTSSSGGVYVLYFDAHFNLVNVSALHEQTEVTIDTDYELGWVAGVVGDIDGNGMADLAVGTASGEINVMFLRSDGSTSRVIPLNSTISQLVAKCGQIATGFGSSISKLGDLDGDGVDEIAVASTSGSVYILWLNGTSESVIESLVDINSTTAYIDLSSTRLVRVLDVSLSTSDDGVVVTFERSSDRADMAPASDDCSIVFDPLTITRLGEGAFCVWLSRTVLVAYYGDAPSLVAGDQVRIQLNSVFHVDDPDVGAAMGTYTVRQADFVALPNAILIASSDIGPCQDLVLNASLSYGDGSRGFKYQFFLESTTSSADTSGLVSALSSISESTAVVTIDRSLLEDSHNYTFGLTITNFRNTTATTYAETRALSFPSLDVAVLASTQAVRTSRQFALTCDITVRPNTTCLESFPTADVVYEWTAINASDGEPIDISHLRGSTARVLQARPFSFDPGSIVFSCEASQQFETFVASGVDSLTVEVTDTPIVARVVGGTFFRRYSEEAFPLDASASFDPDSPYDFVSSSRWTYVWNCTRLLDENGDPVFPTFYDYPVGVINRNCNISVAQTAKILVGGPGNYLIPATYRFDVSVSSPAVAGTPSKASVTVEVVRDRIPMVIIQPSRALSPLTAINHFLLKANVSSTPTVTEQFWQFLGPDKATEVVSLRSNPWFMKSVVTEPELSIRNLVFTVSPVVFRLVARSIDSTGKTVEGFADFEIAANIIPRSGSFIANPSTGEALVTQFVLHASGWTDDPDQTPLTFQFRYRSDPRTIDLDSLKYSFQQKTIPMNIPTETRSLTTTLPPGEGDNGELLVVLVVYDALGAPAVTYQIVQISRFDPLTKKSIDGMNKGLSNKGSTLSADQTYVSSLNTTTRDVLADLDVEVDIVAIPFVIAQAALTLNAIPLTLDELGFGFFAVSDDILFRRDFRRELFEILHQVATNEHMGTTLLMTNFANSLALLTAPSIELDVSSIAFALEIASELNVALSTYADDLRGKGLNLTRDQQDELLDVDFRSITDPVLSALSSIIGAIDDVLNEKATNPIMWNETAFVNGTEHILTPDVRRELTSKFEQDMQDLVKNFVSLSIADAAATEPGLAVNPWEDYPTIAERFSGTVNRIMTPELPGMTETFTGGSQITYASSNSTIVEQAGGTDNRLTVHSLEFNSNPRSASTTGSSLVGPFTAATLQDDDREDINLVDFPSNDDLVFHIRSSEGPRNQCVYFDEVLQQWSSEGCRATTLSGNYTECRCSHFSGTKTSQTDTDSTSVPSSHIAVGQVSGYKESGKLGETDVTGYAVLRDVADSKHFYLAYSGHGASSNHFKLQKFSGMSNTSTFNGEFDQGSLDLMWSLSPTTCSKGRVSALTIGPNFVVMSEEQPPPSELTIDVETVCDIVLNHTFGQQQCVHSGITSPNVTFSGTWLLGSWSSRDGAYYLYASGTNPQPDTLTVTPDFLTDGTFTVHVRFGEMSNRATAVPVSVTHADGIANLAIDMTQSADDWIPLGTYWFVAGERGGVTVSTQGAGGSVSLDAVRFVHSPQYDVYAAGFVDSSEALCTWEVSEQSHPSLSSGGKEIVVVQVHPVFGQEKWVTYAGGPNEDYASSIAWGWAHDLYVAGVVGAGPLEFPGLDNIVCGSGLSNAFVARMSIWGSFEWVACGQGTSPSRISDVITSGFGEVFACGSFSSEFALNASLTWTLGDSQAESAFLAKIDDSGELIWLTHSDGTTNSSGSVRTTGLATFCAVETYVYMTGTYTGDTIQFNNTVTGAPLSCSSDGVWDESETTSTTSFFLVSIEYVSGRVNWLLCGSVTRLKIDEADAPCGSEGPDVSPMNTTVKVRSVTSSVATDDVGRLVVSGSAESGRLRLYRASYGLSDEHSWVHETYEPAWYGFVTKVDPADGKPLDLYVTEGGAYVEAVAIATGQCPPRPNPLLRDTLENDITSRAADVDHSLRYNFTFHDPAGRGYTT